MSAAARNGAYQVPFLRTSNVFWDEIDLSQLDQMSIEPKELEKKKLAVGDLLVCEGGEIGRSAIWDGQVDIISFQNHLHRLRPARHDVVPRFYVYFLQSAFTQLGIFEGAGNKTTIPNLSRNRLAALEVPKPPFEEQQGIVAALSSARTALKINEQLLLTAQELKRAAMREVFTRGLRGEAQKQTEIGLVPESWEVVEFADVRERLQYGTSTRCTYEPTAFPVLRIPNIEPGRVNTSDIKFGTLREDEAKRYLLKDSDLIFIRTNGVIERLGACAVFAGQPKGALFASYLIRAQLKLNRVDPNFAAQFYGSELGTSIIAGRATPAADGKYNLNTGTIDSLPLPLPSTLEEQTQIITLLSAIDDKITLHKRKKAALEALFTSLLHQLMTGKIRVGDLDLSFLNVPQTEAV
jgi:type I restriction enzyme S subunit